jgi:hypothetical protein
MMAFDVVIERSNVPQAYRLLDALTKAGCLSDNITWEYSEDTITLHIQGSDLKPWKAIMFRILSIQTKKPSK